MDGHDIYKAARMDDIKCEGKIWLTAEQEKSVLDSLRKALRSAVSLFDTWPGYGELAHGMRGWLERYMRCLRLGSQHAWAAGGPQHQASSLPCECAVALNAILMESKKANPCIPNYDHAEAVANELATAIALVGYGERDDGLWVERRFYLGLVDEQNAAYWK